MRRNRVVAVAVIAIATINFSFWARALWRDWLAPTARMNAAIPVALRRREYAAFFYFFLTRFYWSRNSMVLKLSQL